jgi:Fic family protein
MTTATGGEAVRAFVPNPLPPAAPPLDPASYSGNGSAEQALGRLSAMSGLVASAEWLIYSSIRKEALLTSQMEGTQATLTDLLDCGTSTEHTPHRKHKKARFAWNRAFS